MPTISEVATILAVEMMRKSVVRAWESDPETRAQITAAAVEMAEALAGSDIMASKFLLDEVDGVPASITFADFAGDFGPAAATDQRHASAIDSEYQLTLASLANAAARQSAKVDLGAIRAPAYSAKCAFEIAATPTAGNVITLYWAPSISGTAGTANPGNTTGSDDAYAGYSSNLTDAIKQLDFIGNFICTAQATTTVQVGVAGILVPKHRYGSLVVVNNSGAAIHSDDVECHIVLDPLFIEGQ